MYVSPYIRITVHTYTLLNLRTEVSTNPAEGNDEGRGSELEGRQRQDADEFLSGDGSGRAGTDPGSGRRSAGLGLVVGGWCGGGRWRARQGRALRIGVHYQGPSPPGQSRRQKETRQRLAAAALQVHYRDLHRSPRLGSY